MSKSVFEAANEIKDFCSEPAENPKNRKVFFGYDNENEEILPIRNEVNDPVPHDFLPGFLFEVRFDEAGEVTEVTLVS